MKYICTYYLLDLINSGWGRLRSKKEKNQKKEIFLEDYIYLYVVNY